MKVHTYASLPHYADHIEPIVAALPPEVVGARVAPRGCWWGQPGQIPDDGGLVLVASYQDARRVPSRRVVLVEHGAGQSYDGDPAAAGHGAFSGGDGLDNVRLFICPSERVCARWLARYWKADAVAVGCPKLDRWHAHPENRGSRFGVTVAITFHHQGGLCPETTWAMPFYRPHLASTVAVLGGAECAVIGHGHPRSRKSLGDLWRRLGVEWVPEAADVFDRADVLVADNTSMLPEFASLGRPVVWLDAPWWRRDVEHGGRFWDWPTGQITVQDPKLMPGAVLLALADHPEVAAARARMVADVYAHTDGQASARAAAAILTLAG